ncbi:MAG: hypothetical protein H7Z71_02285 [Moraxellaceae bacterium]|nr:hypothetical protein [Pseudobdellovibrionaceae bacterium]
MKKLILISIALCCTVIAQAQTKMTTPKTTKETTAEPSATDRIQKKVNDSFKAADVALTESAQIRAIRDSGIFLNYSPIDLLIPNKLGVSFYFSSSDKLNQYEFQYLRSILSAKLQNIDIASMTEQKFSFMNRNFSSGSNFNWYYGLSYATLEVQLGDDYLNSVPASSRPDADALKVHVLAIDLGIGNRWYFENGFTLGFDWLGITQPISTIKKEENFTKYSNNQNEKDDINKFLNFTSTFPRLYFLKFQLGYSF